MPGVPPILCRYYRSYQISEKCDVYSFGVVLLELITGHSPVVPVNESVSIHIGEWVHQNLDHGKLEIIIDSRMGGIYDINSVWKVADLALRCKQEVSRERPTMTDVVAQIKESIELEISWDRTHCWVDFRSRCWSCNEVGLILVKGRGNLL
jgi:serine/threonine protein kinase